MKPSTRRPPGFAIAFASTSTHARQQEQKARWDAEVNVPLKRLFDELKNFCLFCHLNRFDDCDHSMAECNKDEISYNPRWGEFKGTLQFGAKTCFTCGSSLLVTQIYSPRNTC